MLKVMVVMEVMVDGGKPLLFKRGERGRDV